MILLSTLERPPVLVFFSTRLVQRPKSCAFGNARAKYEWKTCNSSGQNPLRGRQIVKSGVFSIESVVRRCTSKTWRHGRDAGNNSVADKGGRRSQLSILRPHREVCLGQKHSFPGVMSITYVKNIWMFHRVGKRARPNFLERSCLSF